MPVSAILTNCRLLISPLLLSNSCRVLPEYQTLGPDISAEACIALTRSSQLSFHLFAVLELARPSCRKACPTHLWCEVWMLNTLWIVQRHPHLKHVVRNTT